VKESRVLDDKVGGGGRPRKEEGEIVVERKKGRRIPFGRERATSSPSWFVPQAADVDEHVGHSPSRPLSTRDKGGLTRKSGEQAQV
jgi:hypothetical protein